eukprot:scaffold410040_cov13-Prasinocladus_malaysianus.AAC.1
MKRLETGRTTTRRRRRTPLILAAICLPGRWTACESEPHWGRQTTERPPMRHGTTTRTEGKP